MAKRSRASTVRLALSEIADVQGDVDAFIAQYEEETRKVPKIAAQIARRLLAAGRAREAWQTIEAVEHRQRSSSWSWPDFEWEDARIDVLEALGRPDDAQAARWQYFERSLSSAHLRAYLKQLPDFDDMAAEETALDHAQRSRNLLQALSFLVAWPAPPSHSGRSCISATTTKRRRLWPFNGRRSATTGRRRSDRRACR